MKKFLILILTAHFFLTPLAFADAMFDEDVDKEIRQKYNTNAIEKDLPKLQNNYPSENIFTPAYSNKQTGEKTQVRQNTSTGDIKTAIKVNKGKSFRVRSMQTVSDSTARGTKITFVSLYPEVSPFVTIPAGTVFRGIVHDSHKANLFGNGGLIVIQVNEMIYKNISYPINATITMANSKHIFLNNIKGKRQYLKNTAKIMKPGQRFMGKMWKITLDLAKDFPEILLTPVSLLSGAVVFVSNAVMSPVLAIFSKGGPITIHKGTDFKIKLREDVMILGF